MCWSLHREICYPTRLLCEEGTVGCHFGRVFENRLSPAAAIILQCISCLSEMQHQSTCCLCLTRLFCISLFCFFLYHRTAKKA